MDTLRLFNLNWAELPEFLYRIIPLHRFIDGCNKAQNTLVSPLKWEDPWEAAQLRTRIEYPLLVDAQGQYSSGIPSDQPRRVGGTWSSGPDTAERVFCQCWSDLSESDAMWKLYSPEVLGVKMKVRSTSLFKSHMGGVPKSLIGGVTSVQPFMGRVEYLPEQEIVKLIADAKANHSLQGNYFDLVPGDRWAKSLLLKRMQFEHESEYRLIAAIPHDSPKPSGDLFAYDFDFRSLVDEIELDPRCKNVEQMERQIRDCGFSGEIRKSRLYEPPPLVARPIWPANEGWCTDSERKMKVDTDKEG